MKRVIVTSSWDDGHKLDLRLAALLKNYGIKGTFYVCPNNQEFEQSELLDKTDIKRISRDFEIGAHTMTHPRLTQTDDKIAFEEINKSKTHLEAIIGRAVTTFCYPRGEYEARHVSMVEKAGYSYARTTKRNFNLREKGYNLEAFTTLHAYNHMSDAWPIAKFSKFNPIRFIHYLKWDNLAIAIFDKMLAEGGVYHLWGHSWEIDKLDHWAKLERVLKHIASREEVDYMCNGDLV